MDVECVFCGLLLEHDSTILPFSTERVLQNKPLAKRYVGCQTDECTYHVSNIGAEQVTIRLRLQNLGPREEIGAASEIDYPATGETRHMTKTCRRNHRTGWGLLK